MRTNKTRTSQRNSHLKMAAVIVSFSAFSLVSSLTPSTAGTFATALLATPKPVVKPVPTSSVKALPATSIQIPSFTPNSINQISSIALGGSTTNPSIYLAGTTDSNSSPLVNSGGLGGTDGFVSAVTVDGAPLWSVRLGDVADDMAMTIIRGKFGNIWVAGLSAIPNKVTTGSPTQPSASPTDQIINPDNVTPTATVTPPAVPGSELTRLTLWMLSPRGEILSTSYFKAKNPLLPQSIVDNSTTAGISLKISGETLVRNRNLLFSINYGVSIGTSIGNFLNFIQGSQPTTAMKIPVSGELLDSTASFNVRTSRYNFSVSNASQHINGLSSFKPKKVMPVVVLRTIRNGQFISARFFPGFINSYALLGNSIMADLYQVGNTFWVSVIKPL